MNLTIYVPDELGQRMKDEMPTANLSRLCQEAFLDELARREAVIESLSGEQRAAMQQLLSGAITTEQLDGLVSLLSRTQDA